MKNKKYYSTRKDIVFKNRYWFTGLKRKLSDEEAKPLLEKGIIYEVDTSLKKFVILDGKQITWSEYLKYKFERSLPKRSKTT